MSCGVLWTEGRGEEEERRAVADFFLESSFVRESDLRSDYFFFFFFFFKRVVRFAHFSVEIARRDRCTRRCTR